MHDEFQPKFNLGETVATSGAKATLSDSDIHSALRRHHRGDWGDLTSPDKVANDRALETEGRIFSKYHSHAGIPFYVITEWDRSLTTVLLTHEY